MATNKHRPSTAERRITVGTAHYPALHGRDYAGDRNVPYMRLPQRTHPRARAQWVSCHDLRGTAVDQG